MTLTTTIRARIGMLAVGLALLVTGCGSAKQSGGDSKKPADEGGDGKTGDEDATGDHSRQNKDDGGTTDGENQGSDGEDGPTGPAGCGVFSAALSSHVALDVQQQVIIGNVNVHVEVDVAAKIVGNGTEARLTLTPSNLQVTPALAQGAAEAAVKDALGERTFKFMTAEERKKLTDSNAEWKGIDCAVVPVKSQTVKTGQGDLVYEYAPALPIILDIAADGATLSKQLGSGKSFKVKATIKTSPFENVKVGDSGDGTVSIKPAGGDGQYTVTPSFGEPLDTSYFGMFTKVQYAIDTAAHQLTTFAVQTPLDDKKMLDVTLKR